MSDVNEQIRQQVRQAMRDQGISQEELAQKLGTERVYVNRMLNGRVSSVPKRWAQVFSELGLRLTLEAESQE